MRSTDECLPTECRDKISFNQRLRRYVLSLGQDIIHMVTNGRVKTPKHVALPLAIKHMTGSVEPVSLLNRFGHGLSRMHLCEVETAMCLDRLSMQETHHKYVPSNIVAGTFVTMCWDNIDFHEETLSGATTHCTNGIMVQRVADVAINKASNEPAKLTKRHARSLPPPAEADIDYVSGSRTDPTPQPDFTAHHLGPVTSGNYSLFLSVQDFLWVLARLTSSHSSIFGQLGEQEVPSWSAFNTAISSVEVRLSAVGYMPVISSSPTELGTVYTLLCKSIESARALGQDEVVVVLDQAIYSKAKEILWRHGSEFKPIVLRMGAFHATCTLLATIGKRFENSGLQDVMVESGVVGASSVASVLSGKHYNRAMRAHKVVFEAILRVLWSSFESVGRQLES